MNLEQFKRKYFEYYDINNFLNIKLSGKIKFQIENYTDMFTIEAYDGIKRVGFMNFRVLSTIETLHVDLIIVQNEYKDNMGVTLGIFKKFKKIYDEEFYGWKIQASFFNKELSETFERMVEKGYFPEGVNETTLVTDFEEETDGEFSSYEEWAEDAEEEYFSINRKMDSIDFDNIPKPYKNLIKRDDEIEKYFLDGAIYKNLTSSEVKKISNAANELMFPILNIMIFDGSDIYYTFGVVTSSGVLPRELYSFMGPGVDLIAENDLGGVKIITDDLDKIKMRYHQIKDFADGPQYINVYLQESILNHSKCEELQFGGIDAIEIYQQNKDKENVANIKRLVKKEKRFL